MTSRIFYQKVKLLSQEKKIKCDFFFYAFQDDFLDLAGDESHHSADIALCLQTGASSLASKDELRPATTSEPPQLDNPSMKLDNLDSWDQDV